MTIADQVATLEQDHEAAQTQITALRRDCAALSAENLALQSQIEDLKKHEQETLAAVETLANASLDMLRTAQRPAGMPAAIIPFAPKIKPGSDAAKQAIREGISDLIDADPRFAAAQPEPPAQNAVSDDSFVNTASYLSAQQAIVDAMPGDSGDEQPAPVPQPEPSAAPISEPPASDAMSRIQPAAMSLPPLTLMRAPAGPVLVRHSDEGLPIFLQRDTVFQRQGGQVFA